LFGPVMNMCSKINSMALPNGIAIGDGLNRFYESLCQANFFPDWEKGPSFL
jgi:hypothetical protein